jgi:alkylation response protein AidB-like acyl-CoA dehydrogenase
VRGAESTGHDAKLWDQLIEMGAPGMGAAESAGGGGARLDDLMVVAEESGRVLAPVALIEHQLASGVLATAAPERFGDVIDGTKVATVALRPARDDVWRTVPSAAVADVVIGVDDGDIVAVHRTVHERRADGGFAAFDDVVTRASTREIVGDVAAFDDVLDRWRVLTAMRLVGAAEMALAIGVDYVKDRKQFGQPIGSFQAVKHGLADLPGLIEGARLLSAKAAWAREQDLPGVIDLERNDITDARALASMALLFAADAAAQTVDRVLHYHGAVGCTIEADVQLYYRRVRAWPLVLSSRPVERRHLADLLLPRS